ncbi:MAG: ribosome-associated translation inhibitor RaiA [Clostridia bacterium]|nr:ribosome-associated translation inhibitor RaiA [Clostridia bacterium]
MKITITGKQIGLTDGLKARVEERFAKLDKYFYKDTEAFVTLSVQREDQVVEATIHSGSLILRVEEATTDMYTSIDNAVDILERQLRKNKTKLEKKMKKEYVENVAFDNISDYSEDIGDELKIVRTKKVESKPMSPEEAVLQMELIGHSFFIFKNGETGETNLVYKRKKGDYGLIEVD